MKILVLYHTFWIEMLADCWKLIDGVEIALLHIPVPSWTNNPDRKYQDAARIMDSIKKENPSVVLDVNGAGILPLDKEAGSWTVQAADVRWCEWWWDDPNNDTALYHGNEFAEKWLNALKAPNVTHFMWDAVMAKEYSIWFSTPVHHLPTAVHPGTFNPLGENYSTRKFEKVDFSFLGSYFMPAAVNDSEKYEFDLLSMYRTKNPTESYFEILDKMSSALPIFSEIFKTSSNSPSRIFHESMHSWRNILNSFTGVKRRNKPLEKIAGIFKSRLLTGFGFPAEFAASSHAFYQPVELAACYRNSFFCIDLATAQCFTGTNMRCYEIMSCEALLAISHYPDFDLSGSLDKTVYFRFSSPDELLDIFNSYKDKPEKISEIKQNARQYVLENHTWLNRFDSIMKVLSETKK